VVTGERLGELAALGAARCVRHVQEPEVEHQVKGGLHGHEVDAPVGLGCNLFTTGKPWPNNLPGYIVCQWPTRSATKPS
jgi:hypothetical protein